MKHYWKIYKEQQKKDHEKEKIVTLTEDINEDLEKGKRITNSRNHENVQCNGDKTWK